MSYALSIDSHRQSDNSSFIKSSSHLCDLTVNLYKLNFRRCYFCEICETCKQCNELIININDSTMVVCENKSF